MRSKIEPAAPSATEIVLTRVFNAPLALVWAAWTEPEHLAQWWGPEGFGARVDAQDLRPGGDWAYTMIDRDGNEYPSHGTFREVVPMERIVTTDEFGEDYAAANSDLPQGIVVTTLFDALDDQTTQITVRIDHASEDDARKHREMGVEPGFQSSFDCLERHLETMAA